METAASRRGVHTIHTMNSNNNMPKKPKTTQSKESELLELLEEKENLTQQVTDLKEKVQRLKIERDIYEKAATFIKKDQGISFQILTNLSKTARILGISRSSLYRKLKEYNIDMAQYGTRVSL